MMERLQKLNTMYQDFKELEDMLEFAVKYDGPIMIRYPRGGEGDIKYKSNREIEVGKAELLKEGNDITIIAIGKMVQRAMEVSNGFSKLGISCEVINARFIKPFDNNCVRESIKKTKNVITIEDGLLRGGLSTTVNEIIAKDEIQEVKIKNWGYDDEYVKQGSVSEIEESRGLDTQNIVESWIKDNNYSVRGVANG